MHFPNFHDQDGVCFQAPRRLHLPAFFIFMAVALSSFAQQSASNLGVEACRRWDTTGNGPPGQKGLYELISDDLNELEKPPIDLLAKKDAAATPVSFTEELHKHVSLVPHASMSWLGTDNVFNTRDGVVSDSVYGLFTGARLKLKYEGFELVNRYDRAFYRYQRSGSSDYDSDTFGTKLVRNIHFLNDKLTFTPKVGLEYSEFSLRQNDSVFFRQNSYSGEGRLSYEAADWATLHLSTTYSYQDVQTNNSADNETVDVGISSKFTPIKDYKFHITPAFHYVHEDFRITPEKDSTYTSSITASWKPLSFLTLDVTGSHAANNASGTTSQASYEALSVTTVLRFHYRW